MVRSSLEMHTAFAEVTAIRYRARTYTNEAQRRRTLEDDVRRGLTGRPKSLPPKYFYDTTGSKLFEDITEQPEYYLTRTERTLLGEIAPSLMREVAPRDLIELGAGSALKTRRLLDARSDQPVRYIPIDVDESMIQVAANRLLADYPLLTVEAIVGDFEHHLHDVPAPSAVASCSSSAAPSAISIRFPGESCSAACARSSPPETVSS